MNRSTLFLTIALLAAPVVLMAQSPSFSSSSSSLVAAEPVPDGGAGQTASPFLTSTGSSSASPLSRVGFGAGISPLGIQLEAATNLSNHFNLRGTGNFFNYSANFTTDGINATAKLNLASARASVDVYPFRRGWRISPGLMFINQNQITAATNVAAGTSFTLNGTTYYSANANSATGATPVTGSGILGLNTNKPAFTVTTGWGNMVRSSGHWSFPFEIGAAFIGAPSVNVNLTGWACYDQAQTECTNIANPNNPIAVAIQSNLTAQEAKWASDLKPLNTFPIVSGGVAYSFHLRKM
ncbi:MAG TPA: hypothetical protein VMQ56_03590 [Terracidiphilus sp.]|nr:hypothetical protein [Terracidiphilus sp.]